uniref:Reverse transcriptase domain-containing protein n=1 Tax=Tanacetum cinerariifolium TaxID=118510 RepID=A0A6L2L1M9_TANCI|nr:hypothetical protein [Tanacetum cinerariifolium]
MLTRSSSNLPVVSPPNPSTSNPKRRNRRRSKQPFILEESPIDTMADQRTMAELLPSVKAVKEIYVTCGGAHPYYQCLTAGGNTFQELRDNIQGYVAAAAINYNQGNSVYRPLDQSYQAPTQQNQKGELKAITTQSGIVLDGPSVPIPPPFINLEEDERVKETLTDQDLAEYTIKPSGNPTFPSHPKITSSEVKDDIFEPEGGNVLPEKLLDLDSTKDLHPPLHVNPLSGSTTYFSSPNQLLEDFADELALIIFPPEYDEDRQFDIESDLKEIEYLLNHDPIKDIDSILKDSIDQSNLADLNDNLVDSMPEMFTDEHALDYSSPSIYDEYDDDLFEVESDTKNVYDDPFDSKGEKIKESKILIDELDLPCDFLLPSEYDSILSEDFSKVDALPSTNNEDKAHAKGFCPPVFTSSALIGNHVSKSNRTYVYLLAYLINGLRTRQYLSIGDFGNGYNKKRQNPSKTGQNRAQNGKRGKVNSQRNSWIRLCRCEKDGQRSFEDAVLSSYIPPYDQKYIYENLGHDHLKVVEAYADKPMVIFKYTTGYKKDYISKTKDCLSNNVPGIPLNERNLEVPNANSGRDIVTLDDSVSCDMNAPSTDIISIPDDEEPTLGRPFQLYRDIVLNKLEGLFLMK